MTLPSGPAQAGDAPAQPAAKPAVARPLLSLSDAAQACSVSRSTIRRRREEGAFPNAVQDEAGAWRIPIEDLLAAGLHLTRMGAPAEQAGTAVSTPGERGASGDGLVAEQPGPVEQLKEQIRDLEQALTLEVERRSSAERLAAERSARVEDLRTALRMLEVGQAAPRPAPTFLAHPRVREEAPVEPTSWWRRRQSAGSR